MRNVNKLINKLKNSLSYFDDTIFLEFFNNNCIIYGLCLIILLNDESTIPVKYNILCTRDKCKELHYFFKGNNFLFQILTPKKKYLYTLKDNNNNDKFIFKLIVDEYPILNLPNYNVLKIENIYFDSQKIGIINEKEFFKKIEDVNLNNIDYNHKIIKKIMKYTKYNYSFILHIDNSIINIHKYNNNFIMNFIKNL
jgi:hypothetical protein